MEMKRDKISAHLLILLLVLALIVYSIPMVESRTINFANAPVSAPAPSPSFGCPINESAIFNVLSFGAKGDGVSDDSKALVAAWKAACKVSGATILIPVDLTFLINPIQLKGPCIPSLTLQIDGILLAPPKGRLWKKSSWSWIKFHSIENFIVEGTGTVDGQGFDWWESKTTPKIKPTALRFDFGYNVTVRNIRIINSPKFHLNFENSEGVMVDNIMISSPQNSPNTDGIHLQNAKDVVIQNSHIGCGDDCISIQTGSSNVVARDTYCGPGHGISIGGLAKDKTTACVINIIVDNIVMYNTTNGARIKTWQGGTGTVYNVTFSNIQVHDVKVPIMVDQYYCDKETCKNQTDAVQISDIKFDQIYGTYTSQPIHMACSEFHPCSNILLGSIQLETSPLSKKAKDGLCSNSLGSTREPLFPPSLKSCLIVDDGLGNNRSATAPTQICS